MGILDNPVNLPSVKQMVQRIDNLTFVKYADESGSRSQIYLALPDLLEHKCRAAPCMGLTSRLEDRMES
jgi:hypothetical protein